MSKHQIVVRKNGRVHRTVTGYATKAEAVRDGQAIADSLGGRAQVTYEPAKQTRRKKAPTSRTNPRKSRKAKKRKAAPAKVRTYKGHKIRTKGRRYVVEPYGVHLDTFTGAKRWVDAHVRGTKAKGRR